MGRKESDEEEQEENNEECDGDEEGRPSGIGIPIPMAYTVMFVP